MNEHSILIRALRAPACYPHRVGTVDVRETHISSVLLTGEFVYKIKKRVRLAFLDFSTLERRRHYCDEELRLNRRFAPDLYLEVVPITGSIAAPHVGGSGAPIDYAVKLRQFDPHEELASLVEQARVEPDELRAFGMHLADIHAGSPSVPGLGKVWDTVRRNLQELGQIPATLTDWVSAEYKRVQPLLEARGAAQRVRECHGDLHAGNVVRWQGALTAFDCIEFDPELRHIDVANDVAFLMMDLLASGRLDLAYAFVNGWLETTGDYKAAQTLRWFRVHRALVRTKVARLEQNAERVGRYLQMALSELIARRPRLIVMCGLSGSGKTWASTQLLQANGGLRVRSDVERKRMAGLQAQASSRSLPGEGIYTREFNERVYDELQIIARTMLSAGEDAIIDAAFLRRDERVTFMHLADELHVPVHIVYCRAPDDELRSRLQARQGDASEATAEVLTQQHAYWEPFDTAELAKVIEVDTRDSQSVRDAIERLRMA